LGLDRTRWLCEESVPVFLAGGHEPTEIDVQAIGKDARFIGPSMGGMRINLRDAHTGENVRHGQHAVHDAEFGAGARQPPTASASAH
jgi:hypothetical protein